MERDTGCSSRSSAAAIEDRIVMLQSSTTLASNWFGRAVQDRRVQLQTYRETSAKMSNTEWWRRGPVEGVPDVLQPVAHILLQVGESADTLVANLSEEEWNARPANIASAAFHVRHMAAVIDRLFTYARGEGLSAEQFRGLSRRASQ